MKPAVETFPSQYALVLMATHEAMGTPLLSDQERIASIVADLMHYANEQALDFPAALEQAQRWFVEESIPDEEESPSCGDPLCGICADVGEDDPAELADEILSPDDPRHDSDACSLCKLLGLNYPKAR